MPYGPRLWVATLVIRKLMGARRSLLTIAHLAKLAAEGRRPDLGILCQLQRQLGMTIESAAALAYPAVNLT